MSDQPQNGAELLARIQPRLREETTYICLRPDLLDAWEEATQALTESRTKDGQSKRAASGVSAETKRCAKRVVEIEQEIEDTQVKVRFSAMPKDRWALLAETHPPRKGNDLDLFAGYNRDAVLDEAVRLCMIDPDFDDASWATFTAVLNPSEWEELRRTVNVVNRGVTEAPKSALAAMVLARRGTDSKSPKPGA